MLGVADRERTSAGRNVGQVVLADVIRDRLALDLAGHVADLGEGSGLPTTHCSDTSTGAERSAQDDRLLWPECDVLRATDERRRAHFEAHRETTRIFELEFA